ncbi:MAG: DUF4347 domain-containing protein, partial [Pseudomonadota bacterium]
MARTPLTTALTTLASSIAKAFRSPSKLQAPERRKALFEAMEQRFLLSVEGVVPPPPPPAQTLPALEAPLNTEAPMLPAGLGASSVPVQYTIQGDDGQVVDQNMPEALQPAAVDPGGVTATVPTIVAIDPTLPNDGTGSDLNEPTAAPSADIDQADASVTVAVAEQDDGLSPQLLAEVTGSAADAETAQRISLAAYTAFVQSRPAPAQLVIVDSAVTNYEALVRNLVSYGAAESTSLAAPGSNGDVAANPDLQLEAAPQSDVLSIDAGAVAPDESSSSEAPQLTVSRFGDIEVVVLDHRYDGIEQMTDILSAHYGLAAVQVLSHGASGTLRLGSSQFNDGSLEQEKARVANWGKALRPGGDVLLYGCDVAKGVEGMQFLQNLAQVAGVDVAASTDATGSAARGGDWTLEYSTGTIESGPLFQAEKLGAYEDLLTGLTPVVSGTTATFTGSAGADVLHLRVSGSGDLEYQWDGSVTYSVLGGFTLAGGTINVDLGSADDAFYFDDASSLSAVDLSILGGAGTDSVTLGENFTLSGGLSVDAESITLSAGFTITTGTGNIAFTASAVDAAQVTNASQLATRTASIQVLGNLTSTSGNITLVSEVVRDVALSDALTATVNSSSSATAVVSGNVETTGILSITAKTRGSVSAATSGLAGLTATNTYSDTATARISNSATINVGSLDLKALSSTTFSASSRSAFNDISGSAKAYIEGSSVTAGAAGMSVFASDTSTVSAASTANAFDVLGLSLPVDISVAAARNQVNKDTEAYVKDSSATVAGDISLSALRNTVLSANAKSTAISSSVPLVSSPSALSIGGTYASNVVLGDVNAYISGGTITTTGAASDVSVTAADTSVIHAKSEGSATSDSTFPNLGTAATATGASIAFNSIGWAPANALFKSVDALIGTDIGTEQAEKVQAYIVNSTVTSSGALSVTAKSDAQLNAVVSNAASSTGSGLYQASSSATSGVLASNMVSSSANAYIEDLATGRTRTVTAGGAITVSAEDNAGIYANSKIVSSSITTNDGGAELLQGVTNFLLPADFSTSDGTLTINFGQKVRLANDYIVDDFTTSQGSGTSSVATNNVVRLADDYGAEDFTTDSGKR